MTTTTKTHTSLIPLFGEVEAERSRVGNLVSFKTKYFKSARVLLAKLNGAETETECHSWEANG